jgi:hypothetical protein
MCSRNYLDCEALAAEISRVRARDSDRSLAWVHRAARWACGMIPSAATCQGKAAARRDSALHGIIGIESRVRDRALFFLRISTRNL